MELLSEPFGYAFFRQGLAVSVLVGLLCGLIGYETVHYRDERDRIRHQLASEPTQPPP